jgi:pimeloyl-ACP methyl ester carboxylesterase
LFIPINKKPAPLFLLIINRDTTNTDVTRKTKSEFWPAEMLIDSGYAIAAFWTGSAAPDNAAAYQNGALKLYPEVLTKDNGAKAIGAWAWAASRVMDYLLSDKQIDAKKVFLVGHSRGGKAALWAGAQDRRFAAVFSNCSGNTGAALSRRRFGETVSRINENFPHWFCNNYKKYNNREDALPVDQHMLLSLIAPRPLYVTSASQDLWADPKGSYLSLLEAQKVYALYEKQTTLPPLPPPLNTPIMASTFGYHNREGIHNLTAYDWNAFIRFANYQFQN